VKIASTGLELEFSEEQKMLRQMIHNFVERECPSLAARDLENSDEFPERCSTG